MTAKTRADSDVLRELTIRFESDPDWLPSASREITAAIHAELPELDVDDEIRVSTYGSTLSVLRLMADMQRLRRPASEAQPPTAAVDYARELVRRGVTIDTLLRAYHVGHATYFRDWAARVRDELTDPDEHTRAVELMADWSFQYVQALNRALVARYAEERDLWIRSAAAIRTDTVRALLTGDHLDQHAASRRLGYELAREHIAFVVWSDGDTASGENYPSLERVAVELATAMNAHRPLVVPLSQRLVAAWIAAEDPAVTEPTGAIRLDVEANESILAAVGSAASGVAGFCDSHQEAMHARRVAQLSGRRSGTVTRYEDVALTALASVDMALARRFVARELGPLAAQDDDTGRLAGTLRVYLEEQCSPRRTAQRLGVHENTIKGRVRVITDLLGHPPSDRVGELLVALRLARLTDRDSPAG